MNLLQRIEAIEALTIDLSRELQAQKHEYLSSKGWLIRDISGMFNAFTYEEKDSKFLTCDLDSAMEREDDRPTSI